MMEGWIQYEGKKVFIILKNARNYSGVIKKVEVVPPLVWIHMIDKFGKSVSFSSGEISSIEEQEERRFEKK